MSDELEATVFSSSLIVPRSSFLRTRSSAESERKLAKLGGARSNRAGSFRVSGSSNRQDARLWTERWRFEPFSRSQTFWNP